MSISRYEDAPSQLTPPEYERTVWLDRSKPAFRRRRSSPMRIRATSASRPPPPRRLSPKPRVPTRCQTRGGHRRRPGAGRARALGGDPDRGDAAGRRHGAAHPLRGPDRPPHPAPGTYPLTSRASCSYRHVPIGAASDGHRQRRRLRRVRPPRRGVGVGVLTDCGVPLQIGDPGPRAKSRQTEVLVEQRARRTRVCSKKPSARRHARTRLEHL